MAWIDKERAALVTLEKIARKMTRGMDLEAVAAHAKKHPGSIGPDVRTSAASTRDLLLTLKRLDDIRAGLSEEAK